MSEVDRHPNPDQVFYYDEDFMLRRMDYSPDVTGSPPIAHYIHDSKTFDGFVFPSSGGCTFATLKAFADQSLAVITIDIDTVKVERG